MYSPRLWILFLCLLFATTVQAGSFEQDILFYTNRYRSAKGRPALQLNKEASRQAKSHSRDMASHRTAFGHNGFEGRVQRIRKKEGFIASSAENVAYGDLTAKEVVDGWIKSTPHRKNILGNYTEIGIGVAKGSKGVLYYTQIFIKK